jgi:RNA polymerase sigma factor (sigma-70 family)
LNPLENSAVRDLALLERWRAGDQNAGSELLGHYRQGFHRLCLRLGVDDHDAMVEIFQDVMLVTVRELPSLPEKISKSFSGWFFWQVRDAIARHRRAAKGVAELPPTLVAAGTSTEARTALREAIRRCWDKLPPVEHQIFELRFVNGLSALEAAKLTGSNVNAVGQNVFRLSRKMRACLGAAGFDQEKAGILS